MKQIRMSATEIMLKLPTSFFSFLCAYNFLRLQFYAKFRELEPIMSNMFVSFRNYEI